MKKTNKVKRILSSLTAVSLSAAMLPAMHVFADSAVDSMADAPLGVSYNVNNSSGYDASNYAIEYSADVVKEGNYSLHVNNVNEVSDRMLITKVPFKTTLSAGDTYKVGFWIYCIDTSGNFAMGTNLEDASIEDMSPSKTNEWVYCEKEVKLTLDATNFQIKTWKGERYIDDLQICKKNDDGTYGENVVMNGNFETLKVYNQKTKTPAQWNMNLWNKLVYDESWNLARPSKEYMDHTFIQATDADAHSGEYSMLYNSYQELTDNADTGEKGNGVEVISYLDKDMEAGKKYQFTAYIKNAENGIRVSLGSQQAEVNWGIPSTGEKNGTSTYDGDGWYKISHVYTGQGINDRMIKFRFWQKGAMFIDDVSLYELDDDGNIAAGAKNMIQNGNFEDCLDFEAINVDGYYNSIWGVTPYNGSGKLYSTKKSDFIRFEEVEPGNYALHLKFANHPEPNSYARLEHPEIALEKGASYTLEYDIKASAINPDSICWYPMGSWASPAFNIISAISYANERTNLDNGWRHCKVIGNAAKDTSAMMMVIQMGCDVLLDNITMYKTDDATKTNLVEDGDFQMTQKRNLEDFTNVIAYPTRAGEAVTVSWTNAYGTIKNAKILLDGTEESASINTSSGAYNEILIDGLTAGRTYTIEVSANINGTDRKYSTTATPLETAGPIESKYTTPGIGDWESDAWSSYIRDGEGYANTNIGVEGVDGNNAAVIKGNIPTVKGNTYAGIEQTLQLDRGKLYKVKFKAKGEGVNRFALVESANVDSESFWLANSFNLSGTWKEYSAILNGTTNEVSLYDPMNEGEIYNGRLLFMTEQYAGTVWIDDVVVCEIDPDDEEKEIGDNLIVDGDFESEKAVLGEPVLTKNGETITKLSPGNINFAVTVKNVDNIALVIALYRDGKLMNASVMEKNVSGDEEVYDTNVTVPDVDGEITAKVMYWNGLTTMVPLRGAAELGQ